MWLWTVTPAIPSRRVDRSRQEAAGAADAFAALGVPSTDDGDRSGFAAPAATSRGVN